MDTAFWSATKLIGALRARKIGALELLDLYAARIERHDRTLNSLCVLDFDAARKRARGFDRASTRNGIDLPKWGS
jgi:amidase